MNTQIINGKELAKEIKERVKQHIEEEYSSEEPPCLACIIVGDNPASKTYVASKEKACMECGIHSKIIRLSEYSTYSELKRVIKELNLDKSVSGILLQLPLPSHLEEYRDELINTIAPYKDVDALTDLSLGALMSNNNDVAPCTATGVMRILESINYNLSGKDVVVIGRSLLVGKSVSQLLMAQNATVTNCHSHTQNLQAKTKQADVIVVAVGKPNFLTADYVKEGAVVIDVGINRTSLGLIGDVDYENVKNKCSFITPVPGGVGPLTVACLMENTVILHELELGKSYNLYKDKLNSFVK